MISNNINLIKENDNKIILVYKYLLHEYLLNCKWVKVCARIIGHIDVEKIKNNIYNEFDKNFLNNKSLLLSKTMPIILKTYCDEKYYYKLNDWYFFLKYILDIDLNFIITILNFFINIKSSFINIYNRKLEILNKLLKLEDYYRPLALGLNLDQWTFYCAAQTTIDKILKWADITYNSYRPIELCVDTIRSIYGFFVKRKDDPLALSKMIGYLNILLYVIALINMKTWVVDY